MQSVLNESAFDLVVGRPQDGDLVFPKHAGIAVRKGEDTFYVLRLNMFPGMTYYLSKNFGENPNYTIFSKVARDEGAARFQNPIGFARLRDDLRTHLELKFNLLEQRLYMSLFPQS